MNKDEFIRRYGIERYEQSKKRIAKTNRERRERENALKPRKKSVPSEQNRLLMIEKVNTPARTYEEAIANAFRWQRLIQGRWPWKEQGVIVTSESFCYKDRTLNVFELVSGKKWTDEQREWFRQMVNQFKNKMCNV